MKRESVFLCCIVVLLLLAISASAQDKVEFLSGISMKGKVVKITDESVVIKIGSRERKFPIEKIHAVTQDGERKVINEKDGAPAQKRAKKTVEDKPKAEPKRTVAKKPKKKPKKRKKVSPKNIDKMIKKAGKDKPDWWDDVELAVPQTLTLKEFFPPRGTKADPQKWPGNYIWQKAIPNPGRWKEGVKLAHACLKAVGGNSSEKFRITRTLAECYRNLLNDYARAAYYYRQLANTKKDDFGIEIGLAKCYAKLGNADMAMKLYKKHERTVGRDADVVRGYTRIGETKLAIKVGKALVAASNGLSKAISLLATGDAARIAGDYTEALSFYKQIENVTVPQRNTPKRTEDERNAVQRVNERAQVAARMVKLYDALDLKKIPDGTYRGKSRGFEGDIEVEVTVKNGVIENVRVTNHKESRFYTALTSIPAQIVENQSLKVDAVTSATISSDAVVAAAGAALEQAMK